MTFIQEILLCNKIFKKSITDHLNILARDLMQENLTALGLNQKIPHNQLKFDVTQVAYSVCQIIHANLHTIYCPTQVTDYSISFNEKIHICVMKTNIQKVMTAQLV